MTIWYLEYVKKCGLYIYFKPIDQGEENVILETVKKEYFTLTNSLQIAI